MKRLANPKWALLLQNTPREECGDVFMAVLKYPDVECTNPAWPFIKAELDEDEAKYRAKCDRLAANRMARWQSEQTSSDINQISTDITMKSDAIAKTVQNKNNSIEQEQSMRRQAAMLVNNFGKNLSVNRPARFLINDDFSFERIRVADPDAYELIRRFPISKQKAAEKSLKTKFFGMEKNINQIIGWIKNEGDYP